MPLSTASLGADIAGMISTSGITPDLVMYAVVGLGALSALILVILALLAGRRKPVRLWQWIAALVVQGLPAALLTVPAVMTVVQRQPPWITVGVVGLWLLIGLTVLRPRWAAWALVVSAGLMPLLLWTGGTLVPSQELPIEPLMMLGFYSARSAIAAGLLWWAGQS